jgi:hypothetical protein
MRKKSDRRMDKNYVNMNFIVCGSSLHPALLYRRNYAVGHVMWGGAGLEITKIFKSKNMKRMCQLRRPGGEIVHLTSKNRASYIYRMGVPLLSKCCILYIFSTNISTQYFKHAAHSPFFSSKCRLFHNATLFDSCIIHILHTEFAKI